MLTNHLDDKVSTTELTGMGHILARRGPSYNVFYYLVEQENIDGISIMKNITPTTLHP